MNTTYYAVRTRRSGIQIRHSRQGLSQGDSEGWDWESQKVSLLMGLVPTLGILKGWAQSQLSSECLHVAFLCSSGFPLIGRWISRGGDPKEYSKRARQKLSIFRASPGRRALCHSRSVTSKSLRPVHTEEGG